LHTVVSGHAVPTGSKPIWQPAVGSHEFVVQAFVSLQSGGAPAWQTPAPSQVSAPLHTVTSGHGVAGGSFAT
jgi:hypothetical protein